MQINFPRARRTDPRSRSFSGAAVASAALLALVLSAPEVAAQTLTYGPIIGRGYTYDQTIVRWGTSNVSDATTIAYRKKDTPTWQLQSGTAARDHEIVLTGLQPGTSYEYEVRSLDTPDGASFSTCPLPGRPMDFVFYGDSRSNFGVSNGEHAKLLVQVTQKAPEMLFESGDIVPTGQYDQYLQEFFPIARELIKTTPFMASPGNHDAVAGLANNYGVMFPTPRPAGTQWKPYYSFTCGNALFVSLDSNRINDDIQLRFLNDQMQAGRVNTAIDHVFVWLHHAPYSVGLHGDSGAAQSLWVPLFNRPENKVTAVFAGHDHIYARMDDHSGVFYVVTGGAGASLYPDTGRSKADRVYSKSTFNFVTVHLAGLAMNAVTYDDTGTEIDRFSVIKNPGNPYPGYVDGSLPVSDGCSVGHRGTTRGSALGVLLLLSCALVTCHRAGRRQRPTA